MPSISTKVLERIKISLKRFQPIIKSAQDRDINESDTVVIITDMLEGIFGYEKYSEISSEHSIRGTYCDLAVSIDDELVFLLEAKAIGMELKDQHVKQAVDYAANQGIDWVILTNAVEWRVYKVTFDKPIDHEIVINFSLFDLSHKNKSDIELLALIAKEQCKKSELQKYYSIKKLLNRYTMGAILQSEPVLRVIKKELRLLSKEIKVQEDELKTILCKEVIKIEVIEGEKAESARKQILKLGRKKRINNDDKSNVVVLNNSEKTEKKTTSAYSIQKSGKN